MVEFHARQPDLRGRGLNMFKGLHEAEIHVEILMAVKQGQPGVVVYTPNESRPAWA
jgi:hypothetical protein